VATSFIPGGDDERVLEQSSAEMPRQLELDIGRRLPDAEFCTVDAPGTRRLRPNPDPLRGGIVIAIFDVGPHQLSVDWPHPDAGAPAGARRMLGRSASAALEFDL
jgi:hypothetical protein